MSSIGKFFAPILPILIIIGMYTGLYNPRVEPFSPPVDIPPPAAVEVMPIGDVL